MKDPTDIVEVPATACPMVHPIPKTPPIHIYSARILWLMISFKEGNHSK